MQGLWVQQSWTWHKSPSLEEVSISPALELPEPTHEWGNWRLESTNEAWAHQDPGKRSSYPTRDGPRLVCECPGVSGGSVGRRWPDAGLGAWSAAVPAWDLLKEVAIIFITPTIVWSQVKQQGGNMPTHQEKTGLNIYWARPCPSEQTRFSQKSVSPIRKRP